MVKPPPTQAPMWPDTGDPFAPEPCSRADFLRQKDLIEDYQDQEKMCRKMRMKPGYETLIKTRYPGTGGS